MAQDRHQYIASIVSMSNGADHRRQEEQELRVDMHLETGPLSSAFAFFRSAKTWNEALNLARKHGAPKAPLTLHVMYRYACWDLLPPRHKFTNFSAITVLSVTHYPHLKHIDVTALTHLRKFGWSLIYNQTKDGARRDYSISSVRITGLAQCKYLESMMLAGLGYHPFILQIKAPVRNLQALESVHVGLACVNPRYPLELATSMSLQRFTFNGEFMVEHVKALRGLAVCVIRCLVLKQYQSSRHTLIKAAFRGPLHDPSLIQDVAFVFKRRFEEFDSRVGMSL